MADVGEVKYKVTADDSGLDKQIDKSESKLKSGFGNIAKVVGAAASAAVAAGAAAVVKITKQAVEAYANYEQLVGGVETLFGAGGKTLEEYAASVGKTVDEARGKYDELKEAESEMLAYADNAYKNAGLSANEYMETVTGFSAALISSLDGDTMKASEVANQAVTDMADNANKMGSSMESIQNAYQGFAKQNYTMLDNLKLGYGGTKEEMARLLADAEKISGVKYDLSNYADVVEAIHVVQTEMGITGTTYEEAASTISGSMAMVKASWENVVTAMGSGDSDQLNQYITDLIGSIETAAGNLLPVVENALLGIAQLVETLAPQIAEKLPGMIEQALPGLLTAGASAIEALAEGLVSAIPSLLPTVVNVIMELARMLIDLAPDLIECGIDLIVQLALGLAQALPDLIPVAIDAVFTIVDTLLANIDLLIDAAIQLIMALAEGLIEALPRLIEKAPEIIMKLVEAIIRNAPKILQAGLELIVTLVKGIVDAFGKLLEVGGQAVEKVKSGFSQKIQDAKNWGRDLIQNFISGIKEKWEALKSSVSSVASTVKSYLGFSEPEEGPLSDFHTYAPDMMDLYAKGIRDNLGTVEDSVEDVSRTVAGSFSADIGYNLPDISGYAADLSAAMTAQASASIEIPLYLDGREIARGTAWYMSEQLAWEAR